MRGFAHGIELCCCVILCSALLSPRRFVTADNGIIGQEKEIFGEWGNLTRQTIEHLIHLPGLGGAPTSSATPVPSPGPGSNVTTLNFTMHIDGFNMSTFGPAQQLQYILDLKNASSGVQKVTINSISAGSAVVDTSADVSIADVYNFVSALADGIALPGSTYGATFIQSCVDSALNARTTSAILAKLAPDPCSDECPYTYKGNPICGPNCPNKGKTCPAFAEPYNGCGSENGAISIESTQALINLGGGIGTTDIFNPVCNIHDICYATPDETQDFCDDQALSTLQQVCTAVWQPNIFDENPLCSIYRLNRLDSCSDTAEGVYAALSFGGATPFAVAQAETLAYAPLCTPPLTASRTDLSFPTPTDCSSPVPVTVSVSAANQPFPDVDATNEVTLRWGDGALDTVELTKLGQGTISHQFQPPPGVFTVMAHYKGHSLAEPLFNKVHDPPLTLTSGDATYNTSDGTATVTCQACEVPCDALNNFCSICTSLSGACKTAGCGCDFFDEDCQYECSLCPYCGQYCGPGTFDAVCPSSSTAPSGPTPITSLPSNLKCSSICNLCPLGCDYYNSGQCSTCNQCNGLQSCEIACSFCKYGPEYCGSDQLCGKCA